MKVKVCGMTSLEQLQQLEAACVDFAGMIFYEKSARFVGEKMKNEMSEVKNLDINKNKRFLYPLSRIGTR